MFVILAGPFLNLMAFWWENNREPLLERGQGKLKETNFFNALKTPGKRKICVSVVRCNVKLNTSKHKYIVATDSQEPVEPLSCVV